MAISQLSDVTTYGTYMSAHDDIWFTVDSTNKAQPNFKYVFDVYIDAALVGRFKVLPHPSHYSYGIFNASNVVRSYLNALYFQGESAFRTNKTHDGFFQKGFVIKYGEEYGTTVTTYPDLTTTPTYTVYNSYRELNNSGSLASYAAKFLTSKPINQVVTLTDNYYVYYFNPAATLKTFTITKYTAAGVSLGTASTTSSSVLIQLNCGVPAINVLSVGFIDSLVSYYTVSDGINYISLSIDCFPKYTHHHLVYLNRLGGYDSAHFRMKNRRTVGTERKMYGKRNYTIHSAGGVVSYHDSTGVVRIGSGGTMSVKQSNKYRLNSDYLSDGDFEAMLQLVNSPVVYMQIGSEYFPVKVNSDSFELKTRNNDSLQAFSVEVEILETFNSQHL